MKRSPFDIDRKVMAGFIVGLITYALTKLSVSLDPQVEQLINVGAALLAAYLVPSSPPRELANERDEADDVIEPPTSGEIESIHAELESAPPLEDPDLDPELSDVPDLPAHVGLTSWAPEPQVVEGPVALLDASDEVDEVATYGEANPVTGITEADVAAALNGQPLEDR